MKKYDAFIFDLDGTICDTLKDIAYCVNYSLKKHHLKTYSLNEFKSFLGHGSKYLIEKAISSRSDLFDSVFHIYMEKYLSNPTKYTKAYKYISPFLLKAKEKGIKLIVYSNKPDNLANEVINKCFGNDLFDLVVGIKKTTKEVKPSISELINYSHHLNINFSNSAYFGDSDVDLYTGINLKVKEIYLTCWGYQDYKYLSTLKDKPTKFLFNPKDLLKINII